MVSNGEPVLFLSRPSMTEQDGSHTSRYASLCVLYWEKTGDASFKERAFRSFVQLGNLYGAGGCLNYPSHGRRRVLVFRRLRGLCPPFHERDGFVRFPSRLRL